MFTAKANDLKYYFVITDEAFSIVQNIRHFKQKYVSHNMSLDFELQYGRNVLG